MNNLTNTILTTMSNLAQSSNALTKVADQLLDRIVPQKDASAAWCVRLYCGSCSNGRMACGFSCVKGFPPRPVFRLLTRSC